MCYCVYVYMCVASTTNQKVRKPFGLILVSSSYVFVIVSCDSCVFVLFGYGQCVVVCAFNWCVIDVHSGDPLYHMSAYCMGYILDLNCLMYAFAAHQ